MSAAEFERMRSHAASQGPAILSGTAGNFTLEFLQRTGNASQHVRNEGQHVFSTQSGLATLAEVDAALASFNPAYVHFVPQE